METTPLLEDLWTHQHKTVTFLGSFRGSRDRAHRGNHIQIYSYWLPADCLQAPITDATYHGRQNPAVDKCGRQVLQYGPVTVYYRQSHTLKRDQPYCLPPWPFPLLFTSGISTHICNKDSQFTVRGKVILYPKHPWVIIWTADSL